MSKRIEISIWGRGTRDLSIAQYAVCAEHEAPHEAVARSIERTTGLCWCGGPRSDGMALPERDRHFAGTLGRPLRSGGYSPEAEVWYAVAAEHYDHG